jgi:hypothetical protein
MHGKSAARFVQREKRVNDLKDQGGLKPATTIKNGDRKAIAVKYTAQPGE